MEKEEEKKTSIVRKKNNFLASFLHVLRAATRDISKINFQVTERNQCSRFSWNEMNYFIWQQMQMRLGFWHWDLTFLFFFSFVAIDYYYMLVVT